MFTRSRFVLIRQRQGEHLTNKFLGINEINSKELCTDHTLDKRGRLNERKHPKEEERVQVRAYMVGQILLVARHSSPPDTAAAVVVAVVAIAAKTRLLQATFGWRGKLWSCSCLSWSATARS